MTFSQKLLQAQITLASGNFGASGGNSKTLSNLRMSAKIKSTGAGNCRLQELAIYGMPLQDMNQLTTLGTAFGQQAKNNIVLQASDNGGKSYSTVFNGDIMEAFVDAQSMPEVCFRITGAVGLFNAAKPIPPTSVNGKADVLKLAQGLAKTMGYTFEGNNVNLKLTNPYLHGTGISQMRQLAYAAGIEWTIDQSNTLAIWPANQSRQTSSIPLVSKDTGMVGYPAFRQGRIIVVSYFNPAFTQGGKIQVQSDLTPANGMWETRSVEHELDCLVPRGKWFSVLTCTQYGTTANPN